MGLWQAECELCSPVACCKCKSPRQLLERVSSASLSPSETDGTWQPSHPGVSPSEGRPSFCPGHGVQPRTRAQVYGGYSEVSTEAAGSLGRGWELWAEDRRAESWA